MVGMGESIYDLPTTTYVSVSVASIERHHMSKQHKRPKLTIVAAMGENQVIGNKGALPWDMPADLAHFKAVTLGKPVIMGLNTYKAIGRLLPGRTNIILSHIAEPIDGAVVAHSIDEALAAVADVDEACVIGGQRIFEQFLSMVDRIELTVIHATPAGDTYFPVLADDEWKITHREEHTSDERNKNDYTFLTYERVQSDRDLR